MMINVKSVIVTVFLLLLMGCSDSRTVTTAANDNGSGGIALPTGGTLNATFSENGVLASSYDQDYLCYDSVGVTFFNLTLVSDNYIYENGSYGGAYTTEGTNLYLNFTNGYSFHSTYDLLVNDSLDFFKAVDDYYGGLIFCMTRHQNETDKVNSAVRITCANHGSFSLDPNGDSSAIDSYANNYYGTYYANMQTGEFLLHYMGVDGDGNVGVVNFPAQVRSMSVIDIVFPDGTEQCIYE